MNLYQLAFIIVLIAYACHYISKPDTNPLEYPE